MKLGEKAIIKLVSANKDEALREMSALAARLEDGLSEEQVYQALVRREKMGSTGIGGGVAIPHAKVEGVRGKLLALGYSRKGIAFDSADRRPVEVMVLLLGEPGPNQDYLHALGKLGRMLRDDNNLEMLLDSHEAAKLDTVFSRMLHSAATVVVPVFSAEEPVPYNP